MLTHWHVAWVGRNRVVFASIEYPEGKPPEHITIAGTTYVREDERKEDGEKGWKERES